MKRLNHNLRIISALWVLLFVNYLDRVAISFAGPAMMKDLALTPAEFGILLSSFGVGYMLAQVPGGLLADKWGAKPVLVVGPLLWALFTGITGLIATLTGFVIVRLCFGISEGLSAASFYKAIGDSFTSKDRARAAAISTTAITLAPAFAGAAIGKIIGAYGWQAMFVMMAVPALIAAAVTHFFIPAGTDAVPPRKSRRSRNPRSATSWRVPACGSCRSRNSAIISSPGVILAGCRAIWCSRAASISRRSAHGQASPSCSLS